MCIMPRRPTKRVSSESWAQYQVAGALFVRALAERGIGDGGRMNIGQLADLRCSPGAPLELLRRRVFMMSFIVLSRVHLGHAFASASRLREAAPSGSVNISTH